MSELRPCHFSDYQVKLATEPGPSGKIMAASTRGHVIAALITFGRYLEKSGLLPENPAKELSLPRLPRKLPENLLTEKEVERLLSVPRLDDPLELRNRAIMELLYATAARQTEVLDLRVEDVDLAGGEARIRRGKGGPGRIVPLCKESVAVLSAYVSQSRPLLTKRGDSGLLFISRRGTRLDPSVMLKVLKRYAARAGIKRPVGFHTFRHSCATHLMKRRVGLRYIQELLGHRSISSTQIYTKVSISDLKSAHAKYHPRERMNV